MELAMKHNVSFKVYDSESDDLIAPDAALLSRISDYVDAMKVPPVGHHLIDGYVVDFSGTTTCRTQ